MSQLDHQHHPLDPHDRNSPLHSLNQFVKRPTSGAPCPVRTIDGSTR